MLLLAIVAEVTGWLALKTADALVQHAVDSAVSETTDLYRRSAPASEQVLIDELEKAGPTDDVARQTELVEAAVLRFLNGPFLESPLAERLQRAGFPMTFGDNSGTILVAREGSPLTAAVGNTVGGNLTLNATIGHPANREIHLAVLTQDPSVTLAPGTSVSLPIELTNGSRTTWDVQLRFNGPFVLSTFEPGAHLQVEPGRSESLILVLTATASSPQAGSRSVSVIVDGTSVPEGKQAAWESDTFTLDVPPSPGLQLSVTSDFERVGTTQRYRGTLTIANRGNTVERGGLRAAHGSASPAADPALPPADRPAPWQLLTPVEYRLSPGKEGQHEVEVGFAHQPWRDAARDCVVVAMSEDRPADDHDRPYLAVRVHQVGRGTDAQQRTELAARTTAALVDRTAHVTGGLLRRGVREIGQLLGRARNLTAIQVGAIIAAAVVLLGVGWALRPVPAGGEPAEASDPTLAPTAGAKFQLTPSAPAPMANLLTDKDACTETLNWQSDGYVAWVERVLKTIWLPEHPVPEVNDLWVDGTLGPQTLAVLIVFQTENGLEPTGQLDPPTRERLLDIAQDSPSAAVRRGPTDADKDVRLREDLCAALVEAP
ncbi:peptidoglycan-binding protein [Nocardioides sp. GY 10113]|uniref:peptidoglycan-binding domain-containing protein n=1 Tax=Nocardioides sp. GY 10113 TaxID=2569761 RepID=UPI0010A920F0|nr:peptidoglycan-binding domain-containing protein [Nocardioides sp. GY 10113]TIC88795.1 peptidoglycan-binding protein [Nocardioides sp. GY 10113]